MRRLDENKQIMRLGDERQERPARIWRRIYITLKPTGLYSSRFGRVEYDWCERLINVGRALLVCVGSLEPMI